MFGARKDAVTTQATDLSIGVLCQERTIHTVRNGDSGLRIRTGDELSKVHDPAKHDAKETQHSVPQPGTARKTKPDVSVFFCRLGKGFV